MNKYHLSFSPMPELQLLSQYLTKIQKNRVQILAGSECLFSPSINSVKKTKSTLHMHAIHIPQTYAHTCSIYEKLMGSFQAAMNEAEQRLVPRRHYKCGSVTLLIFILLAAILQIPISFVRSKMIMDFHGAVIASLVVPLCHHKSCSSLVQLVCPYFKAMG